MNNDFYFRECQKQWQKCSFCGAHNGLFDSKLEQHRPRCRFLGDANDHFNQHPHHLQRLAEDDPHHLQMLAAKTELKALKIELTKLKSANKKD